MDTATRPPDDRSDADVSLVSRLALDLDGTFEHLVRDHQDRLFTIAVRTLGNSSDAEELVQDAFVRAYRALAGYDADRIRDLRPRGWLTTILVNAIRNRLRVRRVTTVELVFEPGAEPAVDPHSRRWSRETWAALLLGLPPAQRTAVVLRHVDGLSYAEIAEALERPEGTIKSDVHRGLSALRDRLTNSKPDSRDHKVARSEPQELTA
jgi:RNA polymerase sigma-70 factor (ECF subfamily)